MSKQETDVAVCDMEEAISDARTTPANDGRLDAIVRIGLLIDSVGTTHRGERETLEGIFDVDLADCDPAYADGFITAWDAIFKLIGGES